MDLIVLVLPLVVASVVFLVFASFLIGQQLDPVQARLQQISVRPRTLEELELQRPIAERTEKLQRFQNVTVGRELEMIRLKGEVNELLIELGRGARYEIHSPCRKTCMPRNWPL